jgi:hypothetical protein
MIKIGRRRRRDTGNTAWASGRDEEAYRLLEEARLRCARLWGRNRSGTQAGWLEILHRELGLAGFSASADLPPERRLNALREAHVRSRTGPSRIYDPRAMLVGLTEQARLAVEGAFGAAEQNDQMHLAHLHVLAAEDLLRAMPRDAAVVGR